MAPIDRIRDGVQRLGLFNAFFNAGILYNSIVFRIVAGVLGKIPPETIAIVTLLEYWVNCGLDIPFGLVADKIGRVKATIAGLTLIALGLFSCYVALLVGPGALQIFLIYLDGILLGLGKSFMSGSFQAFYEDAIRRIAGDDSSLKKEVSASFTKSSEFGRYLSLSTTALALVSLYIAYITIGAEHCFLIGIGFYVYVVFRMINDYRFLGEKFEKVDTSFIAHVFEFFFKNRRCQQATIIRATFQLINSIVSGYLIVTLLRHPLVQAENYFWPMLLSFTIATAVSSIIRGYTLRYLFNILGETRYIQFFYLMHMLTALALYFVSDIQSMAILCCIIFVYTAFFYVAQVALNLISIDILNSAVSSGYRATSISILNMPGFFVVGLYSLYLVLIGTGAPALGELFLTASSVAAIGLVLSWLFESQFLESKSM